MVCPAALRGAGVLTALAERARCSARSSIRNIASLQTPVWLVVRTAPQSAAVPEAEEGLDPCRSLRSRAVTRGTMLIHSIGQLPEN